MIDRLLKMHGIDCIISVDDCYSIDNEFESVKASLFAELNSNIDCIDSFVVELGNKEKWSELKELIVPGNDNTSILQSFIEELSENEATFIYEKLHIQGTNSDYNEKKRLLKFLESLKEKGYIKGFFTFSSTKRAWQEYLKFEIDSSGILWLIDKDFSKVGEASDAGLTLAKNIVEGQYRTAPNYVFILSSLDSDNGQSEDDIEKELDRQLHGYPRRTSSFIYYLYKQRINPDKMDAISKGLAQGFKRKVCYQLFEDYINCIKKGAEKTESSLFSIKQDTLNYLFSERVPGEGESIWEFLVRFVDLFIQDEYRNALAENYTEFVKKIKYYNEISKNVVSLTGNIRAQTDVVVQYRKKEIYDYCVNRLHLEVTTGDIFKIDDKYYILISQACDSCLRANGERVLKNGTLLLVTNSFDGVDKFKYDLKVPLNDDLITPTIDFKTVRSIPFELIDICVLNDDGCATMLLGKSIDELLDENVLFEDRFVRRMNSVNRKLNQIVENNRMIDAFFNLSNKYSVDTIQKAYKDNKRVAPELLDYFEQGDQEIKVCYKIQRICRLQEIMAIDIVRKYGNNVSRIGHDFDFALKPKNKSKKTK